MFIMLLLNYVGINHIFLKKMSELLSWDVMNREQLIYGWLILSEDIMK